MILIYPLETTCQEDTDVVSSVKITEIDGASDGLGFWYFEFAANVEFWSACDDELQGNMTMVECINDTCEDLFGRISVLAFIEGVNYNNSTQR